MKFQLTRRFWTSKQWVEHDISRMWLFLAFTAHLHRSFTLCQQHSAVRGAAGHTVKVGKSSRKHCTTQSPSLAHPTLPAKIIRSCRFLQEGQENRQISFSMKGLNSRCERWLVWGHHAHGWQRRVQKPGLQPVCYTRKCAGRTWLW